MLIVRSAQLPLYTTIATLLLARLLNGSTPLAAQATSILCSTILAQLTHITYSPCVMIRSYLLPFKLDHPPKFSLLHRFYRRQETRMQTDFDFFRLMFHQANLRQGDTGSFTVGPVSGQLSIYQIFIETVLQEMTRL